MVNGWLRLPLNGKGYCVKNSILWGGRGEEGCEKSWGCNIQLRRGTFVELGLKEVTRTGHERKQRVILGWDIEAGKE